MDNLLTYIAVGVSLLSAIYVALSVRFWSKSHKKGGDRVEISGQRERIENQLYEINEVLTSDIDRLFESNKLVLEFPEKGLTINDRIPNYSFFENFGLDMSNIHVNGRTIFCLMPFHRKFNKIYAAIKAACEKEDYTCLRSDEPFNPGNVLRQILRMITESELIIAVLDGKNPNVFYEIGIAHSLGKTVILVGNMENPDDISFDLKSERLLLYSSPSDLQNKLIQSLKNIHHVQR